MLQLSLWGDDSTRWYPEQTPWSPTDGRIHKVLDGPVPGSCLLEPQLQWVSVQRPKYFLYNGCVASSHALDAWCEIEALSSIAPQGLLLNFAL